MDASAREPTSLHSYVHLCAFLSWHCTILASSDVAMQAEESLPSMTGWTPEQEQRGQEGRGMPSMGASNRTGRSAMLAVSAATKMKRKIKTRSSEASKLDEVLLHGGMAEKAPEEQFPTSRGLVRQ